MHSCVFNIISNELESWQFKLVLQNSELHCKKENIIDHYAKINI